jgi:hypothetical protein
MRLLIAWLFTSECLIGFNPARQFDYRFQDEEIAPKKCSRMMKLHSIKKKTRKKRSMQSASQSQPPAPIFIGRPICLT